MIYYLFKSPNHFDKNKKLSRSIIGGLIAEKNDKERRLIMTKNIITREACKKDLRHMAKAALLQDAVLLGVMLLIFVPLILLSISVVNHILPLGLVLILMCAFPPALFIYRIVLDAITIKAVNRGGFSIVKDTVCRLSKGELEARHTVDVIYFTRYGRYIASGMTFDMSCVWDEFYLVILHGKKEKIVSAFHSAMYECKDLDSSSVSTE